MRRIRAGTALSMPIARTLPILLVASVVSAALLAVNGGCSKEAPIGPNGTVSLSVRVTFTARGAAVEPKEAGGVSPRGTADVNQVRASAFEVRLGQNDALRAEATASITPERREFELALSVPPAERYRILVQAIGTRDGPAGASAPGTVFAGEALVDDVLANSRRTIEIALEDVVPHLSLVPQTGTPLGYRLRWTRVGQAQEYRLREMPSERDSVTTDTTLAPGPTFAAGASGAPVSALLQPRWYRVRAELANGVAGAFSESVGVEVSAACSLSTTMLDFGAVTVGQTRALSFTISNTGFGVLSGIVEESCGQFSITQGAGAFDLARGGQRIVSIMFAPETAGADECLVATGLACAPVRCVASGEALPRCDVAPTFLAFGTVVVGDSAAGAFAIRNDGGGVLSGTIPVSCGDFHVRSEAGDFNLTAAESLKVEIVFVPQSPGLHRCELGTDALECADVLCEGSGESPPLCEVTPPSLEFGTVVLGDSTWLPVRIRNTGGGVLTGVVAESCDGFRVEDGPVGYELAAGESTQVVVWFTPARTGLSACDLDMGSGCPPVSCSGTGDLAPDCAIDPPSLDFDDVGLNDSAELSFTIRNDGGGLLAGTVISPCQEFQILSGTQTYSLGAAESHVVSVNFHPSAVGPRACTIETGSTDCGDVGCQGVGAAPCTVAPTEFDIGGVYVNGSANRTFIITNTGTANLSGSVSEVCPYYGILVGAGGYSLAPGAGRTVTIRYAPTAVGVHACNVETGNAYCSDVAFTANGLSPCSISPASYDFGRVSYGSDKEMTFRITNVGPASFSGNLSETCSDFSIVSQQTSYNLAPGGSFYFVVRFHPASAGIRNCAISTGTLCDPVIVSGEGTTPQCQVTPPTLSFSTYDSNPVPDQSFTLANTGTGLLEGVVFLPGTSGCTNFILMTTDPNYSLGPGQGKTFTIRFQPRSYGSFGCTIGGGGPCPVSLLGENVIGLQGPPGDRESPGD